MSGKIEQDDGFSGEGNRDVYGAINWFHGGDRRAHRRHDLLSREIVVHRIDEAREKVKPLGHLVDLSAGGIRLRTSDKSAGIGTQIRIKMELPAFAGISPFVDASGPRIRPKREWTGWITIVRRREVGDDVELGAKLEDIDELDRGMLSLYLSTQPLAA
jgi:hypothetical protein